MALDAQLDCFTNQFLFHWQPPSGGCYISNSQTQAALLWKPSISIGKKLTTDHDFSSFTLAVYDEKIA